MRYAITTADDQSKAEWEVHRADCREVDRGWRELRETIEADSPEEARTDWHDDEMLEMGWTESYSRIMGCARLETA